MKEKYLPIGTVCRLFNGDKNLMITGFGVKNEKSEVYDYVGVLHPKGVISKDINFLFNHDQIEKILYEGFVSDEEIEFKRKLSELVNNSKLNKNNTTNVNNVPYYYQKNNVSQPQMFSNKN